MRASFEPLSVREFDLLFREQDNDTGGRGGGASDISVYIPKYQRGGSIFSVLANLFKSAAPLVMKTVLPEGLNFAKNVIGDISEGRSVRSTLKRRGIQSLKQVGKTLVRGGGGRKKKRKRKECATGKNKKKRKVKRSIFSKSLPYNDIFSKN